MGKNNMNGHIRLSAELENTLRLTVIECLNRRLEYITPEAMLLTLVNLSEMRYALELSKVDAKDISKPLVQYLNKLPKVPKGLVDYELEQSYLLNKLFDVAEVSAKYADIQVVETEHFLSALLSLPNCYASDVLAQAITAGAGEKETVAITKFIENIEYARSLKNEITNSADNDDGAIVNGFDDDDFIGSSFYDEPQQENELWTNFVTDICAKTDKHNQLIGRADELNRTIQVLCRKDKNNVLHIGDPGVGKSAIIYGLARMLNHGDVPERLKGYKIYEINMGDMVAGTQYRGDFEKRIKMVMEGLHKEGKAIVYIDEFHNIIGTGSTRESGIDASNLLRRYFEDSELRFIGATTFAEYKRSLANSRSIMRHFQQIEILEPSIDDAIQIISKLKSKYERFHGVKYPKDVIEFAVKASARYIHDRALPDKAIDLIDEAGAFIEIRLEEDKKVSKELISRILAKICKVDHISDIDDGDNDEERLSTLYERISAKIYGQDSAVKQVAESMLMSRAGLLDTNKPMASLLFVGPTGVGKTEVCKVLAQELGLSLVRFDMSEYSEKHTVAKLIGSPAGYVGYEDGGLLTDAIRKTPNCVLLLDEIEKAHSDIFNLLLQVMDYASLTDNRGTKVDFRHVILIMTSNAGAQHSGRPSIGFTGNVSRGDNMMKAVKSTFKPEFLNRLSGTVVFNDMDKAMESLILKKKLGELQDRLTPRKITLTLSDSAINWLLNKGFTPEYGARELERVINQSLKPLLMHEILFGSLKKGGSAYVECSGDTLHISTSAKRSSTRKEKSE